MTIGRRGCLWEAGRWRPKWGANCGYVEIVDHDMGAAMPVAMRPGDLLIFHSRLMHSSTDNRSDGVRAAMVFHLAAHGTVDHGEGNPVNDWLHLTPAEPSSGP